MAFHIPGAEEILNKNLGFQMEENFNALNLRARVFEKKRNRARKS